MKKRKPAIGISRKVDGFPVKLANQHWFLLHQIYPWLQSIGATDASTDAVLAEIPEWPISEEDTKVAASEGRSGSCSHRLGFCKDKTLRVRAGHLAGMIRLLRLAAAFHPAGQLGITLNRRANDLASISVLDQLADAGR